MKPLPPFRRAQRISTYRHTCSIVGREPPWATVNHGLKISNAPQVPIASCKRFSPTMVAFYRAPET